MKKDNTHDFYNTICNIVNENDNLKAELAEKNAVFAWYADETTYQLLGEVEEGTPIEYDKGKKARAVFDKYKELNV